MKASELNEKTCALVRRMVWDARHWCGLAIDARKAMLAEQRLPFGRRDNSKWLNRHEDWMRYKALRRAASRAARQIAETFQMPCARRTAR